MDIAVVGLGLIGGSLARSTKSRTSHRVFACDLDGDTMMMARLTGAIDGELTEEALAACDLVLLAIRPKAAIEWVEKHAPLIHEDAIVVDMCGVKREISGRLKDVAREHGFLYIGGHPMAGKERGGYINSSEDLFEGASMIFTPDEHTDMWLLERIKDYFTDIGFSNATFATPEEHDRIIAFTSQLAHVLSSSYVKSPTAQEHRGFSAGSFQDLSRVALLDEDMWTELFLANSDNLVGEIDTVLTHLQEYRDALGEKDADRLRTLLKDGRERKASAGGY